MTTALAIVPQPLVKVDLVVSDNRPLNENPAAVYIATLSEGSRPTMRHCLDVIAKKLSGGEANWLTLDWARLRYPMAVAIRSWLMEIYQPATINKFLSALRRVLYHAWKLGQMTAEDSQRARDIASLRYEVIPQGRVITSDELSKLLAVCAQDKSPTGIRDGAMIATMYGTGARRSSLTTITMADYNRESGELKIKVKGKKQLLTYLAGGAKLAVDDWIKLRGDDPGALFCRVWKGGKIRPDSFLSSQSVYDILRRRSGQCGIPPTTPHDMRKSFITDMLEAGVDAFTAQKLAGHASPVTTARYDLRVEKMKKKAVAKLHIPWTGKLE